jgi:predicted phage terminase large subunit-like protein
MRDLARSVLAMPPERLKAFTSQLEPADLEVLERAVEQETGQGWRSSPDAMAHHLTLGKFKRWRYVQLLGQKFRDAYEGTSRRQIWNLGARYGKSSIASRWGPTWMLDADPSRRLILVSYGDKLAYDNAVFVRDRLREHKGVLRAELQPDRQAQGRWLTTEGGGIHAAGIMSGITGFGGSIVIDDPFKDWQQAHSEHTRDLVEHQYQSVVRLRLDDEGRDFILLVMTRWHADDLVGRFAERMEDGTGEAWEIVRLPTIAELPDPTSSDPILRLADPLGREPGELLEPERFGAEQVAARHRALSSYLVAGMEQQRPAPEAGNELLREWFRLEDTLPTKPDASCSSWDLKLKDREAGDYVVGQAWWRVAGGYWCTDQIRGQFDHATTANAIALLAVRHPEIRTHVIEAAGSADEVIPQLRDAKPTYVVTDEMASRLGMNEEERRAVQALRRRGMSGLVPKQPTGDKRVRARAYIAPNAEAGDVHLPARAPWVPALLDELAAFPRGSFDDCVDAMSQALKRLSQSPATLRSGRGTIPVNTAGARRLPRGAVRMPGL